MRIKLISGAAALAALALTPFAAQASEGAPRSANNCFASNNWQGWNVAPDGDSLYLKVGLKDVYQVDLTPGSRARKSGGEFLVNKVRGSNWICSALDLDLAISDHNGFRQPLIARNLRKLSPAEVAAIPRKNRP